MSSLVKTAVIDVGDAVEIVIASRHKSSLIHLIAGIYICPLRCREVITGIYIYIHTYAPMPRELNFSCVVLLVN